MNAAVDAIVYCDGGSRGNPGPAASGCVIEIGAVNMRFLCGKYLGVATNNQAEYSAVELALLRVLSLKFPVKSINFYLDSLLVVNQLNGLFKMKNPVLAEKLFSIKALEKNFTEITYRHVAREKNTAADAVVNQVLDLQKDIEREEKLN